MLLIEMLKLWWNNLIDLTKYCPIFIAACLIALVIVGTVYVLSSLVHFIFEKYPNNIIIHVLLAVFAVCAGWTIVITSFLTLAQMLEVRGLI